MTKLRLIFFFFVVCFQNTNAQNDYPVLTEIVTDNAGLFSESETLQLKQKLTDYETRTTHQIVVLTINDLGNNTVENYAVKTFNKEGNQFGQKEADNGILILVAKNDRKFRIEVGDGLTPIITDLLSSKINKIYITPAFKQGDYYKGIDDATSIIISFIDDPVYAEEFANTDEADKEEVSVVTKFISSIFLTAFFFIIGFLGYNYLILKRKRQKISLKKLFKENKKRFLSFWFIAVCIGTYFNKYLWYLFILLFVGGFLSVFIGIGFFVILKETFKRSLRIFKSLFSGKLGVFIFPFYLPITILLFLAGFMFTFMPLLFIFLGVNEVIFNVDINTIMSGASPIHFLYVFTGIILLFFIITGFLAYRNIKSSLKETFGLSFFKLDRKFYKSFRSSGSSRGYSSGSSFSSSSSGSSFSGGGGSSSGGGSSGSW